MNARDNLARQLNDAAGRRRRRRFLSAPAFAVSATAGIAVVLFVTAGAPPTDERGVTNRSAPAGPTNFGADHQTSVSALREHLERSDPAFLRGTDWSAARSFAIPGTRLRGWTFPQPNRRCLALPDPLVEGYGVTCKTPDEIANGEATVIVTPPAASGAPNIAGVLLTDGATASIDAPAGTRAEWENWSGMSVGTAPSGSRLVVGKRRIAIAAPAPTTITTPLYGVLATSATPISEAQVRDFTEDPVMRRKGIRWDQARRAMSAHDVTVYAVPAAGDDVCVAAVSDRYGASVSCAPPIQRALTIRFGLDRTATLVVGLVPDGATRVDIVETSNTTSAPVVNNGFVARIGHDPATLRWHDSSGEHSEALAPSAARVSGRGA